MNPNYKLIIVYNILPDHYDRYYRYVLGEFVPGLRELGLHMSFAWHIAYGNYPVRQLEFLCESRENAKTAFCSPQWQQLIAELKIYTTDFRIKWVRFEDRFQL
ncbi:MAG: hypothetical protein MUF87_16345 [Anaerolineae bacterium]|jgi:hypothetical protein|nr:hypothetical protein [Anaerolineae bacterium]